MKAIVVDDAKSVRVLAGNWLRECGFEVTGAADGREAWEILEGSGPVDLAVVDWNMPAMTGYELVIKLRADTRFQLMPILMVSTESRETEVGRVLAAGASAYLAKPMEREGFREKLRSLGFLSG